MFFFFTITILSLSRKQKILNLKTRGDRKKTSGRAYNMAKAGNIKLLGSKSNKVFNVLNNLGARRDSKGGGSGSHWEDVHALMPCRYVVPFLDPVAPTTGFQPRRRDVPCLASQSGGPKPSSGGRSQPLLIIPIFCTSTTLSSGNLSSRSLPVKKKVCCYEQVFKTERSSHNQEMTKTDSKRKRFRS